EQCAKKDAPCATAPRLVGNAEVKLERAALRVARMLVRAKAEDSTHFTVRRAICIDATPRIAAPPGRSSTDLSLHIEHIGFEPVGNTPKLPLWVDAITGEELAPVADNLPCFEGQGWLNAN